MEGVHLPTPKMRGHDKKEGLADLLSPCLKPDGRLVLVKQGHPDACVLQRSPSTEPMVLELSSHPGMTLGLLNGLNEKPIDYTDWLVNTLGVVPLVQGLAVGFDDTVADTGYLFVEHQRRDCVFDIAGGNMTELNVLWLLRAAVETMTTRIPHAARTFVVNADLTISPKKAPNLVSHMPAARTEGNPRLSAVSMCWLTGSGKLPTTDGALAALMAVGNDTPHLPRPYSQLQGGLPLGARDAWQSRSV